MAQQTAMTTSEITDKTVWEDFVRATEDGASFLQSWDWGVVYEKQDHTVIRTGFFDGDVLVGVMLCIVEDARRGRYLTVPGGPLIDWNDEVLCASVVESLRDIARKNACVFVRVRPPLESTDQTRALFAELGFRSAPVHLHAELTSQLDLTPSEDDIFAGMRKTTRQELRKADKAEVVVESSDDPTELQTFFDIHLDTAKRQGFVPFSLKFLREEFSTFAASGNVLLYSAKKDDLLLAQAIIIFYGTEAVYHYGASTIDGRKYPGAFKIQWEAIKEAKRRGKTRYNFWGVAPKGEEKSKHRFAGISIFKRGFGGADFEYLHAHDLVISWPRYILNWLIETIRSKSRHV